ncbi:MAG: flagellar biosynthesis anti-sigma factor FlgM [Alicyclobacillus macrosporangiidus]|uniref:flagellar biosynthesis anti-sigma factor FlgM n=1 Tax=Alicyclobacillus macrosporangiidus TaxID=392015 RepID=UPI0026ED7E1D|nr:flagellar biosynthesis anti-sigma factor FlgM [Alicyclobacillus macrosporangiidus]MCL6598698.1 flagellar biosynthesis anti-sigma factor FlgM [Alicyclobacillus macrosporangiidus]
MNGPEFRPVSPEPVKADSLDAKTTRGAERQQKIAELKARVESQQYSIDLHRLAQRIHESGVLDDGTSRE